VGALRDADPTVRLAAARSLAALAPERAGIDLAPLLRDPVRWVRAGVIEALGPVPGDGALAVLQAAAAPGSAVTFEERAAAFSGLAARKEGARAARTEIAAGLRDTSWFVAEAASEAAAGSGDSTLTPDLAWLARHDPDPREPDVALGVAAAFEAFGPGAGKVAADSVRAVLATQLASPDRRIREGADKAMRAVFGDSAAGLARAANKPPAWHEGVLADTRAFLKTDEPSGPLGRVTGARIVTARGTIELTLYPCEAPHTVQNFVSLAERGYFDGLEWHRVVPYFVIQDGDPMGTGAGGPGYTIRCEYNPLRYDTGAVGMALSGKDTGGSQYFITLSPQPHLDGRYTIFGHVVKGQNVVAAMRRGDAIRKVTILRH
jgi:peptidyl-prolyl cis-trans isomerase B (cyclophilin B)